MSVKRKKSAKSFKQKQKLFLDRKKKKSIQRTTLHIAGDVLLTRLSELIEKHKGVEFCVVANIPNRVRHDVL